MKEREKCLWLCDVDLNVLDSYSIHKRLHLIGNNEVGSNSKGHENLMEYHIKEMTTFFRRSSSTDERMLPLLQPQEPLRISCVLQESILASFWPLRKSDPRSPHHYHWYY